MSTEETTPSSKAGRLSFLDLSMSSDYWLRRIFSGGLAAFAKMNMQNFNTTRVLNPEHLVDVLNGRPTRQHRRAELAEEREATTVHDEEQKSPSKERSRGLITVSNHVSGLDDPCVLAAILPPKSIADLEGLRWTLCATDRCFRSRFWAHVFPHVKCIPLVRGAGIDQPLMDLAVELLSHGEWINMFPEGTRSQDGTVKTFRAGIGRLVADASPSPYIVPIAHRGMEKVLPLGSWVPRFRNRIDIAVGEPMIFDGMIAEYRQAGRPESELQAAIAQALEERLRELLESLSENNEEKKSTDIS